MSATAPLPADLPARLDAAALLASPRISPRLREVLRARLEGPAPAPGVFSAGSAATLRALVDAVLPQDGPEPIDLAGGIEALLASGEGNGWRYEALPEDLEAWRRGLATLDDLARSGGAASFSALAIPARDDVLARVAAGEAAAGEGRADRLNAAQMALWFEEVRAEIARLFVAHPATMARIGYGGILGGAEGGARFPGFRRIATGEREPFEPMLACETASPKDLAS